MSDEPREPWVMPEWAEPYRDLFTNTGGNDLERLMNLLPGTGRTNIVLSSLAIACESQYGLLCRLNRLGLLRDRMMEVKP